MELSIYLIFILSFIYCDYINLIVIFEVCISLTFLFFIYYLTLYNLAIIIPYFLSVLSNDKIFFLYILLLYPLYKELLILTHVKIFNL